MLNNDQTLIIDIIEMFVSESSLPKMQIRMHTTGFLCRILATRHFGELISRAMALGLDAQRKLETVVKRLHFLGAPKVGSAFCVFSIQYFNHPISKKKPFKLPVHNHQPRYIPLCPGQILSATIILLALSSNVVIFSEVAGLQGCGVQTMKHLKFVKDFSNPQAIAIEVKWDIVRWLMFEV